MLLLVFAVAAWLAWAGLTTRVWELNRDIEQMDALLPNELFVEDPTRAAVVLHTPTWFDEFVWDIFLPPGQGRQLNLACHAIDGTGFPSAGHRAPIPAGRHTIELVRPTKGDDTWQIEILVDGEPIIVSEQPLSWNGGEGSQGGSLISTSRQFSPNEEIDLFRRRWMVPTKGGSFSTPMGPGEGLLLWISPVDPNVPQGVIDEEP